MLDRLIAQGDVLVENFRPGHARPSSGSTTRRSPRAHPRLIYCSISGLRPDRPATDRAGLRRGHAGRRRPDEHHRRRRRPAVPPRRRDRRHRLRHVRRAGRRDGAVRARTNRARAGRRRRDARLRRPRCSPIRPAIYFATRHGARAPRQPAPDASCRTRRSPASDGEFVLAVGNDEQWRRFCAVAGLRADERFATNRQRVTGYDELRPIRRRSTAHASRGSTGSTG